jgi:hypothetical protein
LTLFSEAFGKCRDDVVDDDQEWGNLVFEGESEGVRGEEALDWTAIFASFVVGLCGC